MQDLDTGVLGEGPGPGNDLDALGQDLFENSSSLVSQPGTAVPSPGGPMLTQHTQPKLSSGPGSQSQPPASPAPSSQGLGSAPDPGVRQPQHSGGANDGHQD